MSLGPAPTSALQAAEGAHRSGDTPDRHAAADANAPALDAGPSDANISGTGRACVARPLE
ncbi:hypothetical protein SPHINGO361_100213 [Sphingomonas sp. EC-HK361]|nr:hypothetical protein SPHINGO361_100213 [Sphingomonas sp. EC-HK361]